MSCSVFFWWSKPSWPPSLPPSRQTWSQAWPMNKGQPLFYLSALAVKAYVWLESRPSIESWAFVRWHATDEWKQIVSKISRTCKFIWDPTMKQTQFHLYYRCWIGHRDQFMFRHISALPSSSFCLHKSKELLDAELWIWSSKYPSKGFLTGPNSTSDVSYPKIQPIWSKNFLYPEVPGKYDDSAVSTDWATSPHNLKPSVRDKTHTLDFLSLLW